MMNSTNTYVPLKITDNQLHNKLMKAIIESNYELSPNYKLQYLSLIKAILMELEIIEIIPELEREIDWTKVPKGTKVYVGHGMFNEAERHFMYYLPDEINQYWVAAGTDMEEEIDWCEGYRKCKLAEPAKEEWYKELNK